MRYSTRTRYGLRFLSYLGTIYRIKGAEHFTQLGEVAGAEEISLKYLQQIVRKLKPLNIFHSARGVKGGYRLTAAPENFKLQNIFDCLEGNTAPVPCVRNNEPCSRQDYCAAHKLWKKLDEHMHSYLDSASLADAMPLGVMVDGIPSMRETANI